MSTDPGERPAALHRMRKIGGNAAAAYLTAGLDDEDARVRDEA